MITAADACPGCGHHNDLHTEKGCSIPACDCTKARVDREPETCAQCAHPHHVGKRYSCDAKVGKTECLCIGTLAERQLYKLVRT